MRKYLDEKEYDPEEGFLMSADLLLRRCEESGCGMTVVTATRSPMDPLLVRGLEFHSSVVMRGLSNYGGIARFYAAVIKHGVNDYGDVEHQILPD